jgi:hypothetical protein
MQRRREHRYQVWESVVISLLDSPDGCHRSATVVDISKLGYRVLLGTPLVPGNKVLITLHSVAVFGVVRHSEAASDGAFTVGVEITKVAAASEACPSSLAFEADPIGWTRNRPFLGGAAA